MLDRVLITGGTGSLGFALVPHFLELEYEVRVLSRDEKKQLDGRLRWPEAEWVLGDVRDFDSVLSAMRGVETVIHCASLKYVDLSEKQPSEYIKTNVLGTLHVVEASARIGTVQRVVGISSDKVSKAVNTYGLTKALLEKLFLEAQAKYGGSPIFTVARYGNVFGTRGSVVPVWAECRRENRPIPLTDGSMTRFMFTLAEAVALVDVTLRLSGGLIVSKPMAACELGQLAKLMAPLAGIQEVGRRPGEKIHEELLTAEEMARTERRCEGLMGEYFVFDPGRPWTVPGTQYTSDVAPRLTDEQLLGLLSEYL